MRPGYEATPSLTDCDTLISSSNHLLHGINCIHTRFMTVVYWEPSLTFLPSPPHPYLTLPLHPHPSPPHPHPSQEAHKMVDFVLRHGNDLLAVESLRGFEVSQQIQQVNSGA